MSRGAAGSARPLSREVGLRTLPRPPDRRPLEPGRPGDRERLRLRRHAGRHAGLHQADEPGRTFASYTSDTFGDGTSTCHREAQALGFDVLKPDGTGRNGTFIVDISNPVAPRTVSFIEMPQGSHNQTIHPSGNFLYNSNSDLMTSFQPAIEIHDISNPAAPAAVGEPAIPTRPGLGTESASASPTCPGCPASRSARSRSRAPACASSASTAGRMRTRSRPRRRGSTVRTGDFYLCGNDVTRGMDVYKFEGAGQKSAKAGQWMTPAQAQAKLGARPALTATSGYRLARLLAE
jgi:hypothetical protein